MGSKSNNSAIIVVFIALLTVVAYVYYSAVRNNFDACETVECVTEAARILNGMDLSADPCNNFYQYSCGGWVQMNPIPDDRPGHSQFGIAADRTQKILKEVLSSYYSNDRDAIKKAKLYYKACVNEDTLDKASALPAFDLIKSLGGFPLFDGEIDKNNFTLENYLAKTTNKVANEFLKRSSALINMDVDADDTNSTKNIIILDQPLLGMPNHKYYLSDEFNSIQSAYRGFLRDMLELMWKRFDIENGKTTFNAKSLNETIHKVYQMDAELAKIIEPKENRLNRSALHNKMTLKDMSVEVSPDFNWAEYVKEVMAKVAIPVDNSTEVVVKGKPYLSKMMSVLNKYNRSEIQNYVVIHNLAGSLDLLSRKYRDADAEYRKETTGTDRRELRWKVCISKANALLGNAVGALYTKVAFSEESKNVAMEMIDNIMESFKIGLDGTDWMDVETKRIAKLKVDAVRKFIGYPDYILDEENPKLDDELKDVDISEDEFYKAEFDLYRDQLLKKLKRLNQPVNRQKWGLAPSEVNAYYDVQRNSMYFAAGVFQSPFFNPGQPFAMNFGGIGDAIGHELTHGFDITGATYNEKGNLKNWWSDASRAQFENASQCFNDQYSNFFYEAAQMFVNGNLTIRENIADNGGLRYSYEGYQLWKSKNREREFKLPGLENYTPEQLFFIANGQTWCSSERPEAARRRILSYYHSPGIFRVEGSVMNFEEFGKVFGCKKGVDKLYPNAKDTCRVW